MTKQEFNEQMKRIDIDPNAWSQWAEENPEAAQALVDSMPELQLLPVENHVPLGDDEVKNMIAREWFMKQRNL